MSLSRPPRPSRPRKCERTMISHCRPLSASVAPTCGAETLFRKFMPRATLLGHCCLCVRAMRKRPLRFHLPLVIPRHRSLLFLCSRANPSRSLARRTAHFLQTKKLERENTSFPVRHTAFTVQYKSSVMHYSTLYCTKGTTVHAKLP